MMVSNVNRSESSAVTGIPGLSELPGFQMPTDQNAEKDTGQLVVVVTPHVVRRRSDMASGPRIRHSLGWAGDRQLRICGAGH